MYGFTENQLRLICEAIQQGELPNPPLAPRRADLLAVVYDAIKLDSLERKWKVDSRELERSLEALTDQQAARLAAAACAAWDNGPSWDRSSRLLQPTAWLYNSAVIHAGQYGTYEYSPASADELRTFIRECDPVSRIGYEDTCDYIYSLTRYQPPVSRAMFEMAVGEKAMVIRLRRDRIDPQSKGAPRKIDGSQWEIARLERLGK
jgi:hypothetical protein